MLSKYELWFIELVRVAEALRSANKATYDKAFERFVAIQRVGALAGYPVKEAILELERLGF